MSGRENNVVRGDFTRKPEPPPGATISQGGRFASVQRTTRNALLLRPDERDGNLAVRDIPGTCRNARS